MRYVWISMMMVLIVLSSGLLVQAEATPAMQTLKAEIKDFIVAIDHEQKQAENSIIIADGKTYLPIRDLFERANYDLKWNKHTNVISIKKANKRAIANLAIDNKNNEQEKLSFHTDVKGHGAIVIEDSTDQIMFEKNGYKHFYPASTVKVMTALLAIEHGDLNDLVTVSSNVYTLPSDSRRAYISPGDQLTLKDLLYGMLLYSGNDCALAIAEHIGGSEEKFVAMMNEKAKELGALQTQFVNPHGYHHPDQYTTPHDLAKIAKAASKYETFINIIKTPYYHATFYNKEGNKVKQGWKTTNKFLKNKDLTTSGVIGGKTGYTDASRHNLVTIAEKNNHQYITVILKGESYDRYYDTRKLLKHAYSVREQYDAAYYKQLKVVKQSSKVRIDGLELMSEDQFIYNGTTYFSIDFIKQFFHIEEKLVTKHKLELKIDEKIIKARYYSWGQTMFSPFRQLYLILGFYNKEAIDAFYQIHPVTKLVYEQFMLEKSFAGNYKKEKVYTIKPSFDNSIFAYMQ